ncbi:MAG: HD-GYP domain-containing protein [Candidatus Pristimantibacillus sp.]
MDDLESIWFLSKENPVTLSVIKALFFCLNIRDPLTANHSINMAYYSYHLAEKFDRSNAVLYYFGSLTHDIGKIGMDDRILKGKEKLSFDEREYLRQHVIDGCRILSSLKMPNTILEIVKYHHERYDGSGYLEELHGENIPLAGRITAISDTFSALTSDRPYSRAMSKERAIEIMQRDSMQFDPEILEYFIQSIFNQ